MRENEGRSYGPPSDLYGMLLRPNESSKGQYCRIGLLTVYRNEKDPDIMVSMTQGRDQVFEKLYMDDPESGYGIIEIV